MVNAGPSNACNTCKKRKVRCDQKRPICCNCIRLEIECAGYSKKKRRIKFKHQAIYTPQTSSFRGAPRRYENRTASEGLSLRRLGEPIALYAISFFFDNFVSVGRNFESTRGFIENIIPIYTQSRHMSPISLAVAAIATSVLGIWNRNSDTCIMAARYFSAALNRLQDCLNDPSETKRDENLMASILLQLHETLHAVKELRPANSVYQNGAMSLVGSRGIQNFRSDTAKYLLLYVRSAEVCCAICEGRRVDAELASLSQYDNMPSNPSLALDGLGVLVANVQACFLELSNDSPGGELLQMDPVRMINLYHALDLERELMSWSQTLPEHWWPVKIQHASKQIPTYINTCEIYPSIHIASVWNTWRCYRLIVNKIILAYDLTHNQSGHNSEISDRLHQVQAIVDSICYSVPFHLGNLIREIEIHNFSDSLIESPVHHNCNQKKLPPQISRRFAFMPQDQNIRHTIGQGTWHIASHLSKLVTLLSGEPGYLLKSCLRAGQLTWIFGQLHRVATLFKLPEVRSNTCEHGLSGIDTDCILGPSTSTQIRLAKYLREGFKFTGI